MKICGSYWKAHSHCHMGSSWKRTLGEQGHAGWTPEREDSLERVLQNPHAAKMPSVPGRWKKRRMTRKDLSSKITKVATKKQTITASIEAMQQEADIMAKKAKRKQDFTLLIKSNACRKSVAEKKKEVSLRKLVIRSQHSSKLDVHPSVWVNPGLTDWLRSKSTKNHLFLLEGLFFFGCYLK